MMQTALVSIISAATADLPLTVHPQNHRYFLFRGQPFAPMTATEHFGAVVNLDFDYETYLDSLVANNFTITKTWTGSYVEPDEDVGPYNTLDPKVGRFIAPWLRSDVPGNRQGGNKFDLTSYNRSFFERMHRFVSSAGHRGIVVELGLFAGWEQTHEFIWEYSPFHPDNNINGFASVNSSNVYSLERNGGPPRAFTELQLRTVHELAASLRDLDNHQFLSISVANRSDPEWGEAVAMAVRSADPDRLVASTSVHDSIPDVDSGPRGSAPVVPGADIVNFGAQASPKDAEFCQRPASMDNTGAYTTADEYRISFWRWMLGGGGAINALDWTYCDGGFEDGSLSPALAPGSPGQSGPETRSYLRVLALFFQGLDFVHMSPDTTWLTIPGGDATGLARFEQHRLRSAAAFIECAQAQALELRTVPPGGCDVEFLDPTRGNSTWLSIQTWPQADIDIPCHNGDLAFRVDCREGSLV